MALVTTVGMRFLQVCDLYYQYLENLQHRSLKKIELLLYRFSSIVASISLRILEQARVTWHTSHFYLRRLFNLFLSFLS